MIREVKCRMCKGKGYIRDKNESFSPLDDFIGMGYDDGMDARYMECTECRGRGKLYKQVEW